MGNSNLDRVVSTLATLVPRAGAERVLAEDVQRALAMAGLTFVVEAELSTGRVDLMVGSTAVELKVKETPAKVLQQLQRYARDPDVSDLLLVTTSAKLRRMPVEVEGKRLAVLYLMRV